MMQVEVEATGCRVHAPVRHFCGALNGSKASANRFSATSPLSHNQSWRIRPTKTKRSHLFH